MLLSAYNNAGEYRDLKLQFETTLFCFRYNYEWYRSAGYKAVASFKRFT